MSDFPKLPPPMHYGGFVHAYTESQMRHYGRAWAEWMREQAMQAVVDAQSGIGGPAQAIFEIRLPGDQT